MNETGASAADVAAALRASVGLLVRRLRQVQTESELTLSEASALAQLDREGPTSSAELARSERISPQSMGATIAALEARGLIARAPDPRDGRRVILSLTASGRRTRSSRTAAKTEQMARVLASEFSDEERRQLLGMAELLERLARDL